MDAHHFARSFTSILRLAFYKSHETDKVLIRVGLEYGVGGRILAWALDFPGCFAYGQADAEVMLNFARNLLDYEAWINLHADQAWFNLINLDFRIVEVFKPENGSCMARSYKAVAFFEDDRRALTPDEAQHALAVYSWQREELLAGLEFLPEAAYDRAEQRTGKTIPAMVSQMAQDCYDILTALKLPLLPFPTISETLAQLDFTTKLVRETLPAWVGVEAIYEVDRELWSPRKVMRHLLWRQREGIEEIKTFAG
jgi:hypothetical protein